MKYTIKISTLFFGVIVAAMSFSYSELYADNKGLVEFKEFVATSAETLKEIETNLMNDTATAECESEVRIRIYNTSNQLVYECRDKDDQKLKILLRRSDLLLHTDTSSYYLLGD